MTWVDVFDFLPFGKYAFYIWFSYLTAFGVVGFLFIRTTFIHKTIQKQLRNKYLREAK